MAGDEYGRRLREEERDLPGRHLADVLTDVREVCRLRCVVTPQTGAAGDLKRQPAAHVIEPPAQLDHEFETLSRREPRQECDVRGRLGPARQLEPLEIDGVTQNPKPTLVDPV